MPQLDSSRPDTHTPHIEARSYQKLASSYDIHPPSDQSIRWIALSLFITGALFIYAYALYCLSLEEVPLQRKISLLKEKKEMIIREVSALKEMIQASSDPAADEYALITRQGKIPEGYTKIEFGPSLATTLPE